MATSRTTSAMSFYEEEQRINLPREMWIEIWSFLDFKTLQKTCTLVSKTWLEEIRNSTRLSGEMTLKTSWPWWNVKEINKVLSHWKKLRVLHMTMDKEITGFNLNEHFLLRKIIIPKSIPLEDLDDWAMSKKIWLDPKDYSSKPQSLENVVDLEIDIQRIPENFPLVQIGQIFTNVKGLFIIGKTFNTESILGFKNLKKLDINIDINIEDLLETLHMIENAKDLEISADISTKDNELGEIKTLEIYQNALEFINNKFTKESSTEFKIEDYWYNHITITIKKSNKKGGGIPEGYSLVKYPEFEECVDHVLNF